MLFLLQIRPKGNSNKKKSKKDKVKPIELSPESPDDRPTLRAKPDSNKFAQKETVVRSRSIKSDSSTYVTTTTSLNR